MYENKKIRIVKPGEGEIETVDIFAEAMNLNEEEAAKLLEPEPESEYKRGIGEIETVDIFAEAMNLNEEEAAKLLEPEPESDYIRGEGEIETLDIFAEAMNLNEIEQKKLEEYTGVSYVPEEQEYMPDSIRNDIKNIFKQGVTLTVVEMLISLVISLIFHFRIIPEKSDGMILTVGCSFLVYFVYIIIRCIRTERRTDIIKRLMPYGVTIAVSLLIWAAGVMVKAWGMNLISWTFMPFMLLKILFFGTGALGNLLSVMCMHAVICAEIIMFASIAGTFKENVD